MQGYFALTCFFLLILMVLSRAAILKRKGIQLIVFARTHHSDFLILPFVLFYVYHLLAGVFGWPGVSGPFLLHSASLRWLGVAFCVAGVLLFLWGLLSFGNSFRVGIDTEAPAQLITSGAFAVSRNPLYVAFALNLIGFFLVFPTVLFLIYLLAGFWLFRRQILREEAFLQQYYGEAFAEYCRNVRRYL